MSASSGGQLFNSREFLAPESRGIAVLAACLVTALFGVTGGIPGLVIALFVLTSAVFVNELIAYSIGSVMLAALTPDTSIALSAASYVVLSSILLPLLRRSWNRSFFSGAVRYGILFAIFTSGIVLLNPWYSSALVIAVLVLAGIGLCGYALHRYERVKLGLVETGDNS